MIEQVLQGIPVLVAVAFDDGSGHAFIVYDYDSNTGKLYGHMGWGSDVTHADISTLNYLYMKNAMSIIIDTEHSHTDNYAFCDDDVNYCSCYFPCHPEHVCTYTPYDQDYHIYNCGCIVEYYNKFKHNFIYNSITDSYHEWSCFCGATSNGQVEHTYKYTSINPTQHILSCACGATSGSSINHVYTVADELGYAECKWCGYLKYVGTGFVPIIKTKLPVTDTDLIKEVYFVQ